MVSQTSYTGLITRFSSGFYTVELESETLECKTRGRLKRGRAQGDIISLGDRVEVLKLSDGTGVIESVKERKSVLARMDPRPRGEYQQVFLANPDQVVIVFACTQPEPRMKMLDRFLVIAEKNGIIPLIVANKVDLMPMDEAQKMFSIYQDIGYEVLFTSANARIGLDALHTALTGRISALAGPSGVGKSSLLNAIQPHLGLNVRAVSQTTSKGKHTTVVRQLFKLNTGGYVADLPGLKSLAIWDIEPEEVDGYFPDLRDLVPDCRFSDCSHQKEPGCAVLDALEKGELFQERYESYLRIRFGDEEDEI
ncbi:MAG: ribosome small subunit-dependent GTPase A [Anaerolineaceae bacterium]|nr:ribosome small subunit-dependent GTPase A [Anaerolineaceae bacterium]